MDTEFQVSPDGKVEMTGADPVNTRVSSLGEILVRMQDPNSPVAEVSRMITIEMTSVLKEMTEIGPDPLFLNKHRSLNDQIKALRELQKSLSEADLLSKKDILNFDGPKFQFVFGQLLGFYRKALKEAGVDDSLAQSVMKHFSDAVKINEEKLRRETLKVDSSQQ